MPFHSCSLQLATSLFYCLSSQRLLVPSFVRFVQMTSHFLTPTFHLPASTSTSCLHLLQCVYFHPPLPFPPSPPCNGSSSVASPSCTLQRTASQSATAIPKTRRLLNTTPRFLTLCTSSFSHIRNLFYPDFLYSKALIFSFRSFLHSTFPLSPLSSTFLPFLLFLSLQTFSSFPTFNLKTALAPQPAAPYYANTTKRMPIK